MKPYRLAVDAYEKADFLPQHKTLRHHVRPDNAVGMACSRLCMLNSLLRNVCIREIDAYFRMHGTYQIDDAKASASGFPLLGKDGKGRQMFYKGNIWSLSSLYHIVKNSPEFRCGENTKMLKLTLQSVGEEWSSWSNSCKAYKKDPSKFKTAPKRPRCKGLTGQYKTVFTKEAISESRNSGYFSLADTGIDIPNITLADVAEIEIKPERYGYSIIVAYVNTGLYPEIRTSHDRIAGLDLGLVKTATLTSNHSDVRPAMIKGGGQYAINLKAEREIERLRAMLPNGVTTSRKIDRIVQKQRNRTDTLTHTTSRRIVQWLYVNRITLLVCGYNAGWKQKINLGKVTNHKFTRYPFDTLIRQLTYKAREDGAAVVRVKESYTSKTSFMDGESIEKHPVGGYAGKRISRGIFRSADGTLIHADVNGSLNIMRKYCGEEIFEDDRRQYAKNAQHISLKLPVQSGSGTQGNRHQPGAFQFSRTG